MEKTLILLRHVPGSGASSFAKSLINIYNLANISCLHAEADQYFENRKFNYKELPDAHYECQAKCKQGMLDNISLIVISNTMTSEEELKPYYNLAIQYSYRVVSLIVENRHGGTNVHNVPEETIKKYKNRLKQNISL